MTPLVSTILSPEQIPHYCPLSGLTDTQLMDTDKDFQLPCLYLYSPTLHLPHTTVTYSDCFNFCPSLCRFRSSAVSSLYFPQDFLGLPPGLQAPGSSQALLCQVSTPLLRPSFIRPPSVLWPLSSDPRIKLFQPQSSVVPPQQLPRFFPSLGTVILRSFPQFPASSLRPSPPYPLYSLRWLHLRHSRQGHQ